MNHRTARVASLIAFRSSYRRGSAQHGESHDNSSERMRLGYQIRRRCRCLAHGKQSFDDEDFFGSLPGSENEAATVEVSPDGIFQGRRICLRSKAPSANR